MYIPIRKAAVQLGMHPNTLRKYADNGTIPSIKNAAGQRLFDVDSYLRGQSGGVATICYCRVSSTKQRDDLQRQADHMQTQFPDAEIVSDIGSGLNFKRKGLTSILERILRGDKLKIVVANRDRLARFGFDLIETLVRKQGGEILVLDSDVGKSRESELTEDLLAILHHFSCRMHGARSHKNKTNSDIPQSGTEGVIQEMVGKLSLCLQSDDRVP